MANEEKLYWIIGFSLLILLVGGLSLQGTDGLISGLFTIMYSPARLVTDYIEVGGPGAAMLNGVLVGFMGLLLIKFSTVRLSGPTVAAVFTLTGFGFFGKTPINILPIILGVYLTCRLLKQPFTTYSVIALFGTALGPALSYLYLEAGLVGIYKVVVPVVSGLVIGIILPPIAIYMLKFHQGYSLYNLGMTCGFIGIFIAAFLRTAGFKITGLLLWNKSHSKEFGVILLLFSLYFLLLGAFLSGKKAWTGFRDVQKQKGRLPSDFIAAVSMEAVLLNIGALGLLCCLYIYGVGGDFNGPTLGGALTVMGFGAFGKTIRNCLPVIFGVYVASTVFGLSPAAPGAILAALFCTTLAPLAGEFGIAIGVCAGFIHLAMVHQTSAWHGGMDLYNNGFAGGLTATLIVALLQWFQEHRDAILSSNGNNK